MCNSMSEYNDSLVSLAVWDILLLALITHCVLATVISNMEARFNLRPYKPLEVVTL